MTNRPITPDLLRAALAHIPANLPREEWARVAMAIKSEFPGDEGRDIFDAWSATASDGYDPKAVRDTWRSVRPGGGVGVGTLLHLARGHGFVMPAAGASEPRAKASASEARAAAEAARQARERDDAERLARQQAAAAVAQGMWDSAVEGVPHEYLAAKRVQAHGVRVGGDGGELLVPMRDIEGALWSLQRIRGRDKKYLPGARKTGLMHWIGPKPVEAAGTGDAQAPAGAPVLLVAEGYATAASLHEATGLAAVVAFDAGNLKHVARALHERYPLALVAVCGDDDLATLARTGSNPGRKAAEEAAHAAQGLAVLPQGLPEGGSDFNDLAAHAGAAVVREQVLAAIAAHHAQQSAQQPTEGAGDSDDAGTPPKAAKRRQQASKGAASASDEAARDPFTVDDSGVYFQGRDREGKPLAPEWVCSRLDVTARTRDGDAAGWGYLLTFADPKGTPKQWAMPARLLAGDGGEYRAMLLNMGLLISPSPRARGLLTTYIQTRQPEQFATCTDKTGWHDRAFVLPLETIGDGPEPIVFQTDAAVENTFRERGTAEQWRSKVAAPAVGNSRLVFALACAFAGPLLRPAGVESGGFHLRGDSSCGKTTALRAAASVWGGPSFLQRWRATDNALEAIAAQHSDCLLPLDELAQVDPRVAGETAYMLANEQAKGRASRTGMARPRLTWRVLFLSAGEVSLSDHMSDGMKRTRTGQEVRMADVPADAGAGMGMFEQLHDADGPGALADRITRAAGAYHGTIGREWLVWLTTHADTLRRRVVERQQAIALQLVPEGASGQVGRVAGRFALVAAAGELATEAGLTGWPQGESERAARACFNAWLAARGGSGNGEVTAMLRQVRGFLEAHGEGRFSMWHRGADDHAPKTLARAGVRRMLDAEGEPITSNSKHLQEFGERMPAALGEGVSYEYFVLPEVFKAEVCKGFDMEAVCNVLHAHGCLMVREPGRFSVSMRLPGIGKVRAYHVAPAIFDLDL